MNNVLTLLCKQLELMFGMGPHASIALSGCFQKALDNTLYCLASWKDKYHSANKGREINPFHTGDYMVFLYYLSHELFVQGEESTASRVYYLNKILNCVDLFYAIELPSVWGAEHPLGSVMGRAKYGEKFFFYQGCTVGGNHKTIHIIDYPEIGNDVIMYSNSKIVGAAHIGNHCVIAANAYINGEDIPDNSMVFGQHPNLIIKTNKMESLFLD